MNWNYSKQGDEDYKITILHYNFWISYSSKSAFLPTVWLLQKGIEKTICLHPLTDNYLRYLRRWYELFTIKEFAQIELSKQNKLNFCFSISP